MSQQPRRLQSQPAHRVREWKYATLCISLFFTRIPQTILTLSHSLLHRTCRQRHSPERSRALQTSAPADIRHESVSEWISSRDASRTRHH